MESGTRAYQKVGEKIKEVIVENATDNSCTVKDKKGNKKVVDKNDLLEDLSE